MVLISSGQNEYPVTPLSTRAAAALLKAARSLIYSTVLSSRIFSRLCLQIRRRRL